MLFDRDPKSPLDTLDSPQKVTDLISMKSGLPNLSIKKTSRGMVYAIHSLVRNGGSSGTIWLFNIAMENHHV